MKIFVLSKLEDLNGSINAFPITACTNKELALNIFKKIYDEAVKSFNENEVEFEEIIEDDCISLSNDGIFILISIEEIELEGEIL